jgi:hypothetical protein
VQIATKAPRHKAKRVTFWLIFIFGSLCLGGVNVLPQNAKKIISKVPNNRFEEFDLSPKTEWNGGIHK